jgi:hypothetical protein
MMKKKTSKKHPNHKLTYSVIGVVILLLAAGLFRYIHDHKKVVVINTASTGSAYTKGGTKNDATSKGSSTPTTPSSGSKTAGSSTAGSSTGAPYLQAPEGTFANVYNTTLNEQMGSTCNTTPGATCTIEFINGSQTYSLPVKVADSGGGVYWSWTPGSIGLSAGTWHIMAIATLGSQTKTTNNDPLTLSVQ